MSLFSFNRGKIERINKVDFRLEKDIQKLTEENLDEIFGLEFVRTEFQLNNLRVDTLAFDKETNSFVIIEYKKDKNFSVIDQGYAYLTLLLNNKSDFILEYNEYKENILRKNDIDWSQSRVIFISPQFTEYQRQAIGFKDLPMELWEINLYKNDTVLFNRLKSSETSESIKTVSSKSKIVQEVSKEVKVHEEEDSLRGSSDTTLELYKSLNNRILDLGEIELKPFGTYVAFKANNEFVCVRVYRTILRIILNIPKHDLDDPKSIVDEFPKNIRFGKGDIGLDFKPEDDLDYLMTLIKQSYNKNSS